jgi:meiotically up-regulated gene 157 (Mug157) protein
MPVYLIRAGDHGPVKIGWSDNVALRLVKMQADNHERLTVLRLFAGGLAEEEMLHERFADNWLHGEWFAFSKAMLGDLRLERIGAPTPESITNGLRKLASRGRETEAAE